MTIHFCPRQLKPHWPDPDAAWRARADFDAAEVQFAVEWRVQAFDIWRATRPLKGTLAEVYLQSCGIHQTPPTVRFHGKLAHPLSLAGAAWPALVCLVTDGRSGLPLGIHATFLTPDGASLAPIKGPMVTFGTCDGGVARLGEPPSGAVLIVGTGIEACLRVAQDSGEAVWAVLSERDLAGLDLPRHLGDVIILAGNSPDAAVQAAAWRWRSEGRRVAIVQPLQETEVCGCPHPRSMADSVH